MKKSVTVSVNEKKLSAIEMYLEQKNTTLAAELEKYAEHDSNGNVTIQSKVLKEKLDQLTPVIKVGKIAGKKAITISYIYKQSDVLFKIDTSMVSANDRLYLDGEQ